MTIVEIIGAEQTLSQHQRWSFYLTFGFAITAFVIGINLRDSALYATTVYVNRQAGIEAAYPENWLIDTSGRYVFRVRDTSQLGFKTTIQVNLFPTSSDTDSLRSVLDALNLNRAQLLARYDVQSTEDGFVLPDGTASTRMDYTFVSVDENSFLESVPVLVQGVDILINRRGQAMVVTFLTDLSTFEQNFAVFERFLADLKF